MKNTTLVYIEKDNKYLMLHRTKKEHDENSGKWIGIGGHFEDGESPDECMLREVLEETGLTITKYRFRGIVTFVSDEYGTEYMHLFTANGFTGNLKECDECKKLLICSRECYLKNRNKMQHICQMFACDDCLNKNGTVDIYNIKEQEVLINVNLNEFINNNTSGRNMDKNQSMNIFNNQTNPNLSINKDKNNGVKEEKRKTFCCCDYCFIF